MYAETRKALLKSVGALRESALALLPIVLVVAFFELVVLRQSIPNLGRILAGALMVVVGLTLFVRGLQMALFPIGEEMAYNPALIAIAEEAARIAAVGGVIGTSPEAQADYALGLRLTVAVSVGFALLVGVFRILKGWPVQYLIIAGYTGVVIMTIFAPQEIIGIAYDSGGVTTSTVTVPLVAALGIGLASYIHGRDPLIDGFGLIAFASLTPMIFVMGYGMFF
jgi:hypothetical protein